MRKTKEVLRLRFELGFGQRQISRCCGMGLGTVHEYLERATAAGIGWPLPEGMSEEELEAKLFGNQPIRTKAVEERPQPDWKAIHEELQRHRHLTLQLVWEEYRQANPEGYRYSWFCERYQHWRRHLDVVLRQEHKAGEKMFVDWAGPTISVYDSTTGQAWPASLFVAVLGASSYTYVEATRDQQLVAWIQAHIHALEFYGGTPTLTVPDRRGFINRTGDYVLAPIFARARSFGEGLAAVKLNDNKWGYINEAGEMVIDPAYDHAGEFHDGEAGVRIGEQRSFIDTRGQVIFRCPPHCCMSAFCEGLAVAISYPDSPSESWYLDRNLHEEFNKRFTVASIFGRVRP